MKNFLLKFFKKKREDIEYLNNVKYNLKVEIFQKVRAQNRNNGGSHTRCCLTTKLNPALNLPVKFQVGPLHLQCLRTVLHFAHASFSRVNSSYSLPFPSFLLSLSYADQTLKTKLQGKVSPTLGQSACKALSNYIVSWFGKPTRSHLTVSN